ncbi:regulator of telomere length splice variant [Echinococcus multilocularis]|uniref:Regulator of telomere elongation helicase 1 homolog n=1 Tax=Echinococcus multilocularis TaxID=6211 RepID=A0A068Y9L0_ECHMU|nr:regulator of telomere length splice variant [Echinococcus multilocularis]
MPLLSFGEVEVTFPHEPYECQKSYMQSVVNALSQRRHAILESPTGTGKTLCLLCASLGWLEYSLAQQQLKRLEQPWDSTSPCGPLNSSNKFDAPLLIFSSRTHAQLNQAVQAFKNTVYSSRRIGVLGSRDQLCSLPEVLNLETNSAKVYQCRLRVSTRTCEYYRNFDASRDKLLDTMKTSKITDIEDLVKFGRENRACAYYLSREVKSDAEILFMPYNYLLDVKIRTLYGIELTNAVVIFDEAHNIEQVCEDAASATLTSAFVASAIEELRVIGEYIFSLTSGGEGDDINGLGGLEGIAQPLGRVNRLDISQPTNDGAAAIGLSSVLTLKGQLLELERLLDGLGDSASTTDTIKPGEYVFELLGQAGITINNHGQIQGLIDQIINASISMDVTKFRRGRGLSHVSEFLQKVFVDNTGGKSSSLLVRQRSASCFRVHVKVEFPSMWNFKEITDVWGRNSISIGDGNSGSGRETKNVCLSYWCLTPGRAMHELLELNVRNIILTSGTLYPITSLQAELGLQSAIVLQNPHVVNSDQIHVAVLPKAPDGGTLNSSFEHRANSAYHRSLGLTLMNLFRVVPGGVLVFFPSYALMKMCLDSWQNSDIYNKFLDSKKIFTEPRDKTQFQQITTSYMEAATNTAGGSVLFSVMRGKASEGLDLADQTSRAVVIVGIAYPPREDPRVKIKMAFLDERRFQVDSIKDLPTGRQWYKLQAWRAVNQAVGRVIRHIHDFGAVFLCDERFASPEARSHLPTWMRSSVCVYDSFGPVLKAASEFFRTAQAKYPTLLKGPMKPSPARRSSTPVGHTAPSRLGLALDGGVLRFPGAAGHIATYVGSLSTSSGVSDFPADYSFEEPLPEGEAESSQTSSQSTKPSTSLLDRIYCNVQQPSLEQTSKRPSSDMSSSKGPNSNDDEAFAARLLKRHQTAKRIKLVKQHLNPETGDSVTTPDYLTAVRTLFSRASMGKENHCFEEFKGALLNYKANGTEAGSSSVERVFAALASLFIPLDAPGLLRDFIVFVRDSDKPKYAELCKGLTGLSVTSGEDTAESSSDAASTSAFTATKEASPPVSCVRCKKSPITDALRAPCGHICCFSCWRIIIEEGNRRCPVCSAFVRRRDLVRLARRKLRLTQ